jgi:hypothetical protein
MNFNKLKWLCTDHTVCLVLPAVTAHLSGLHSAIKMLSGKLSVIKEHMDRIAAGARTSFS